ncbi:MAG: preprotein translocase subunit SecY [Deltaproteobacteria bacterium]|nr:preprotein translocase subunit SecY [Deltaproteobacteria bacterium]
MNGFGESFKIPELRKRVFFTIMMLVIYRIGVFVPTPGIDADKFKDLFEQASSSLFGVVNMFSGGALENFSIFTLGIMPYISVSIIMQLMQGVFKPLEELAKEGEQGRRKISRYTRIITVFLALFQGYMISMGLEKQGLVIGGGFGFRVETAITLTAGTMFVMWLGEQITERGLGNGISIVIMAGIVARMPATIGQTMDLMTTNEISPAKVLLLFVFAVMTIAFIVFCEQALRKIPVQYPKRAVGRQMTQAVTQHLPLKINSSGVIPPIFASTLLSFPLMIIQFGQIGFLQPYVNYFYQGSWIYELVFALLITFFAFFYTAIVFDPEKVAENLKRNGGFVPTVRPGKDTAEYLDNVLKRLTVWGSVYLSLICILPQIVYRELNASSFIYFFGGTAVLIVVGVVLDTIRQIESHVVSRNYDTFMKKGFGKMRGGATAAMPHMKGRLIQR